MKISLLLCFLLVFSANAATKTDAKTLLIEIEWMGVQSVIARLNENQGSEWQYVMEQVGNGDSRWLDVASRLAPGTSGKLSASLSSAVALAIPRNAMVVLEIMTSKYAALSEEQICSLPFNTMTEPQLNQYVVDAIRALYKAPSGKSCLDTIVNTVGQSNSFHKSH
jgi:hypothetical protein